MLVGLKLQSKQPSRDLTLVEAMKTPTVRQYVAAQLELCGRSQSEVARACGFASPQMISMIKSGAAKVPISKIRVLASALRVDPMYLFRLVMAEYQPEVLEVLDEFQPSLALTQDEIDLIVRRRQTPQGVAADSGDARVGLPRVTEATPAERGDRPRSGEPDW